MSEMSGDPVCGMVVARESGPHFCVAGQTYFFCSAACRDEFAADPARFTKLDESSWAGI